MITIKNTDFTSNVSLAAMLMIRTKEYMLDTCKKLYLYVSPNLKRKRRHGVSHGRFSPPLAVLCNLSKSELQLVDEFVKAGPDQYITRKMRKTQYKLQKYSLIQTYEDFEAGEWKMLMPDSVRESLATSLPYILSIVEKTGKAPKYKDLQMLAFLNSL